MIERKENVQPCSVRATLRAEVESEAYEHITANVYWPRPPIFHCNVKILVFI